MGRKHHKHKPEEIVAKLRRAGVLTSQGLSIAGTARSIEVSARTYLRWLAEYGEEAPKSEEDERSEEDKRLAAIASISNKIAGLKKSVSLHDKKAQSLLAEGFRGLAAGERNAAHRARERMEMLIKWRAELLIDHARIEALTMSGDTEN